MAQQNNKNNHKAKGNDIPLGPEDTASTGSITITQKEYSELKASADKAKEYWDRLLRAQAEFENIRKRLEKERQDTIRFANEELILDLLMVLDDLERSVNLAQQNKEDFGIFLKGIELILGHLYDILKKRGLSPIEAEGKAFDPHLHEALLNAERDDLPEHTIIEELQKGYLIHERVLRAAKVKISKHTAK